MSSEVNSSILSLKGKGVLVTRPAAQALALMRLIKARGGRAYLLSALEITFVSLAQMTPQLRQISAGDILIFISQNAVEAVFKELSRKLHQQICCASIAAVGKRTQHALERYGCTDLIVPDDTNQSTEGLLQHASLQAVRGKNIFIVRGQSGRECLFDSLQVRGAQVQYISSYQRAIPAQYQTEPILHALSENKIDFILVNSVETFENLAKMLAPQSMDALRTALINTQVIVPSERIAEILRERYDLPALVSQGAADEVMLTATSAVIA